MATRATKTLVGETNLTECHCCHLPCSKLHILPSEWRLVILCNNCLLRVESAALCPYCFSSTTADDDADWFSCSQCKRRVHNACDCEIRMFGFSAADVSASAVVCGDCWFPESLMKWRRLLQSKWKISEVDLGIDKSRVRVSTRVVKEEIGDGGLGFKEGEGSSSNAVVKKEAPPQEGEEGSSSNAVVKKEAPPQEGEEGSSSNAVAKKEAKESASNAVVKKEDPPQTESLFMNPNRGGGGIDFLYSRRRPLLTYQRRRRTKKRAACLFGLKYKRRTTTTGGHSVDIQADQVNADTSEFREVV